MKRTIAMMIVFLLILGGIPLSVAAESTVGKVQQKVDALPALSSVESVEGETYAQAFTQAKNAVYALARLTEQEMEQVVGYEKAFQLYIDLIVMKATSLLPNEPMTLKNYAQQALQLETINSLLFNEEPLFLLAEYTEDTVNENFYPPETTKGFVSLYDIQIAYHEACDNRTKFLESLTDAQWREVQQRDYAWELTKYPDVFNDQNVLTYAKDFVMLIYEVENWEGKYFWLNQTSEKNSNRYDALRESFELSMGIFGDCFIDQIDDEIARLCQYEKAASYSPLRLQLIERPIYDTLAGQIEALEFINGERIYMKFDHWAEFENYQQLFWPASYIYGDANGDYLINAADALIILKVAVGKAQLSKALFDANDVNADGKVDAKDALYVLQYAVEKIYWFPVEMELYGILA